MLENSTGKGKRNRPADVTVLQLLLNATPIYSAKPTDGETQFFLEAGDGRQRLRKLVVNGMDASKLAARITAYQSAKKFKVIDGWVGKAGGTLRCLLKDARVTAGTSRMAFIRSKFPAGGQVQSVNVDKTLQLYDAQYGTLPAADKDGLRFIVGKAVADTRLGSLPEFAYMLATTKHETAHSFRPVAEHGKGAGRAYGKAISVTDPGSGKTCSNTYYGRGYVQLTWGYNYQRLDQELGNGTYPNRKKSKASEFNKGFTVTNPSGSVYLHPDKAMDKDNAYLALVWGMQNGIFTYRALGRYVSSAKTDYWNARRVINGTDRAADIAAYAENLEILLLLATN